MRKLVAIIAVCFSLTACADTSQISQQVPADEAALQSQLDRIEANSSIVATGSAIMLGILLWATGIVS